MFAVEAREDVLARLHGDGAELIGELEQYEETYRLCYVGGPGHHRGARPAAGLTESSVVPPSVDAMMVTA